MRIKEQVHGNRVVLAPTLIQQSSLIILLLISIGFAYRYPLVGVIAFLVLLYILGELIGHRVIIDKATGSITVMKRHFLLFARQRVITFGDVVNVDVVRTWTVRLSFGDNRADPNSGYAYGLRIEYRSKQGLQTTQIDKDRNEDSAIESAEAIRQIIGGKVLKTKRILAEHNRRIEANPNDAYAYYARGDFFREIDEYDLAIADCDKAIQLSPGLARPYHGRGLAYHKKGEVIRAVNDLEKCIELSHNSELTKAAQQALSEIKNSP